MKITVKQLSRPYLKQTKPAPVFTRFPSYVFAGQFGQIYYYYYPLTLTYHVRIFTTYVKFKSLRETGHFDRIKCYIIENNIK